MLLEKLYAGEYYPSEKITVQSEEYKTVMNAIAEKQEQLLQLLDEDGKQKLEELCELFTEESSLSDEANFQYGFASGVQLMSECKKILEDIEMDE